MGLRGNSDSDDDVWQDDEFDLSILNDDEWQDGDDSQNNDIPSSTMTSLKTPKPLVVNSDNNMAQEWTDWLDEYENYLIASKMSKEEAAVQTATFKHCIGPDAMKILNNMNLTADEMTRR